jgi:hypothetical protein
VNLLRDSWWWLCAAVLLLAAPLLVYSQTSAFTFDEAYHLLAAQLIARGKRPYIDFAFPQAPLNTYWNALWMRPSGPGDWHLPHLFEALFVIGAVMLAADYVYRRFPVPAWRLAAALTAATAVALNPMVFQYGPVAQPYGMSLFALVLTFRVAIAAVDKPSPTLALLAGASAGSAVASTFLVAAAGPVFFVWMLLANRAGSRWRKTGVFCAGTLIPFLPVMRLFVAGPKQTWFNLIQYHLYYRRLYWTDVTRHDLEVLTSWIDSGPALALGLLALVGLVASGRWSRMFRSELFLCAGLSLAVALELSLAHPTFAQYFLFTVPFMAILVPVGLCIIAPDRPRQAVALVALLFVVGLTKSLYDERDDDTWKVYERIARKLQEVAPNATDALFADEPIYFLTGRTPPAGLELFYTHKLNLPAADARLFHIIDYAEMERQVKSGKFAAAYSCVEEDTHDYGLSGIYTQRQDVDDDCTVFWDLSKAP